MRHDLFRFSGNHVPHAAILLSRHRRYGTHTAIIYRDDQGRLRRIEFYLDGNVKSSEWNGDEFHVIPNVDDEDALANLAALCQVVAGRYDLAPPEHLFGFRRSPRAYIDAR